ncbi:MAG: arginyltransferase [Mizugakiibacter sp.]|uniref:arginyltransferase n=1 Tax=Mizugakiibacter sp. TaxID=1972610 RepID=UPI0031BC4758|nr:arginyltransferase [Xanthomonadaceae bacterium]
MRSDRVRLLQTLPHGCGYFRGRTAQNLVLDPSAADLPELYATALGRGFRRAGGHVYIPHCPGCRACVPCRIPVDAFEPDRSQRRCLARNADLELVPAAPGFTPERHALYARYLHGRHRGGGMDDASDEDFTRFLTAPWSPTLFLELRKDGRLLAVAVTDVCTTGVSAVYTFFDPEEAARGLGTYAVLRQIQLARERALPHLYLGFWIDRHPKMDYKRRFRPLEVLRGGGWEPL